MSGKVPLTFWTREWFDLKRPAGETRRFILLTETLRMDCTMKQNRRRVTVKMYYVSPDPILMCDVLNVREFADQLRESLNSKSA